MNNGATIKAIGVGGGGGNMINHLVERELLNVDLIVANTDVQALDKSNAPYKIQIGASLTKGLGAGMKPEVGENSALESEESIHGMLVGSDLVFIATGLGGGTGTGAAPVIAKIAKNVGALSVSIVTTPFRFEGRKRKKLANEGLNKLREVSDAIIHVSNENLLSICEKNLGMRDSFRMVDEVLSEAIVGISSLITNHGTNDINLDFSDVRTVMTHKGLALMGVGKSKGGDSAVIAAEDAMSSPLLDSLNIDGALGIIVHFNIHPDYPLQNISEAMNIIEDRADENADIIFGTSNSDELDLDEVKITLIATGFENEYSESIKDETLTKDKPKELSFLEKKLLQSGIISDVEPHRAQRKRQRQDETNLDETNLDEPTYLRNLRKFG